MIATTVKAAEGLGLRQRRGRSRALGSPARCPWAVWGRAEGPLPLSPRGQDGEGLWKPPAGGLGAVWGLWFMTWGVGTSPCIAFLRRDKISTSPHTPRDWERWGGSRCQPGNRGRCLAVPPGCELGKRLQNSFLNSLKYKHGLQGVKRECRTHGRATQTRGGPAGKGSRSGGAARDGRLHIHRPPLQGCPGCTRNARDAEVQPLSLMTTR